MPSQAVCLLVVEGFADWERHTSNGLQHLQTHVPGYSESAQYLDVPVVRDRGLITASGLGDVEFARQLFEELGVLTAVQRAQWAEMFRSAKVPGGGEG